jgi:hypothetical protein
VQCGIIAPRRHELTSFATSEKYLAECVRESNHLGPHVIKTPDGIFIAWEDDWNCGCCKPEEDDRCYVYWEIEESDIPKLK